MMPNDLVALDRSRAIGENSTIPAAGERERYAARTSVVAGAIASNRRSEQLVVG